MRYALPSPELVAAIILAAARECGENAQDIVDGKAGSRARIYAYVALRERCGRLTIKHAAQLCFAPNVDGLKAYAVQALRRDWWDAKLLARVSTASPLAMHAPDPAPAPPAAPNPTRPKPSAPMAVHRPAPKAEPALPRSAGAVQIIRHAKPAAALNLNPIARRTPPARSTADVTADLMGDPPAERSALAEWKRREAMKAGADQ